MLKNTVLSADQSAEILTSKIVGQEPFVFLRYGDGAIECINQKAGCTRDGEKYSGGLGAELLRCWNLVIDHPNAYIGDWLSASFTAKTLKSRYEKEYEKLIRASVPVWLHYEALLLRKSIPLLNFYKAVRDDPRRKLLMGPREWEPAAALLKTDFLVVPMSDNLYLRNLPQMWADLLRRSFSVLLYGAGMAGHIPVIDHWFDKGCRNTYIHLGSALDPLYRGRTREQQMNSDEARRFFAL